MDDSLESCEVRCTLYHWLSRSQFFSLVRLKWASHLHQAVCTLSKPRILQLSHNLLLCLLRYLEQVSHFHQHYEHLHYFIDSPHIYIAVLN